MRRIGSPNPGVRARRLEAQFGERRVIDGVNDVVRHARMVLMAYQQLRYSISIPFFCHVYDLSVGSE